MTTVMAVSPELNGGVIAASYEDGRIRVSLACQAKHTFGRGDEYRPDEIARMVAKWRPKRAVVSKPRRPRGDSLVRYSESQLGLGMWVGVFAAHSIPAELVANETWRVWLAGKKGDDYAMVKAVSERMPMVDFMGESHVPQFGLARACGVYLYWLANMNHEVMNV